MHPLLNCRQAKVIRLHEELAALKVAPQQVNDNQKALLPLRAMMTINH